MLVMEYIERPWEIMEKQSRIKDLLFPDDELPQDISRSTLEENLSIIAKDDGVALVLTDKLLFPRGQVELDEAARTLLARSWPSCSGPWTSGVNIAGYADGEEEDPYTLSGDRALAVLAFLVEQDLPEQVVLHFGLRGRAAPGRRHDRGRGPGPEPAGGNSHRVPSALERLSILMENPALENKCLCM